MEHKRKIPLSFQEAFELSKAARVVIKKQLVIPRGVGETYAEYWNRLEAAMDKGIFAALFRSDERRRIGQLSLVYHCTTTSTSIRS